MKAIVEFPSTSGTCIPEVEVNDLEGSGLMSSRTGEMITTANQTFQEVIGTAKSAISTIVSEVRSNVEGADEMTIDFGMKVGLKYGLCITASGECHNWN